MPELAEDEVIIPITKYEAPKRRMNHKQLHRYRELWKKDGVISKIILVESLDPSTFEWKNQEKLIDEITKTMSNDTSGMRHFQIQYSLGKAKRWEMARKTAEDLPEPKESISSLSLLKFNEYRTGSTGQFMCTPHGRLWAFHRENPFFRYYNTDFHEFSVKTPDSFQLKRGKFNNSQKIIEPDPMAMELKIHIQYHVKEFKLNKKLHNSEKWKFWHDARDQYCRPSTEGSRIKSDVARMENGNYVTAIWEMNGLNFDQDCSEEIDETEVELPKPPTLTLANFLVPRIRRQRKKSSTSEQWVLV